MSDQTFQKQMRRELPAAKAAAKVATTSPRHATLSSNSGWKGDFSRIGRLLENDLSVFISDLSDRSIDRYKAASYISIYPIYIEVER
jgi:uncharacterized protein Veg